MRRQIKGFFGIAVFVLLSSGCGVQSAPGEETEVTQVSDPAAEEEQNTEKEEEPQGKEDPEETKEPPEDTVKKVQIALVTDVSSVMDNGFNQAALQGIQTYADGAGVPYSCYSTDVDTLDSYEDTILMAIQDKAELIICAGSHFEQAVGSLQEEYEDVSFLLLDGVPRDSYGNLDVIAPNVHCITYREEEAGYLVGYMSVLEGYRKLGFIGGEELPSVQKYGIGYLQGIDAAADTLEVLDEIQVEYWYADTFSPNRQIEEVAEEWYQDGVEVIFACGGSLYQSVLPSAETEDGMLIGADVDQSDLSERFLTSAMKGIDASVIVAIDEYFANGKKWPEDLAGNTVSYGAKEKCISLPVQDKAWRFQKATTSDYLKVLAQLRSGDIQISIDTETPPETAATVIYHNQQEEKDS